MSINYPESPVDSNKYPLACSYCMNKNEAWHTKNPDFFPLIVGMVIGAVLQFVIVMIDKSSPVAHFTLLLIYAALTLALVVTAVWIAAGKAKIRPQWIWTGINGIPQGVFIMLFVYTVRDPQFLPKLIGS